MKLAALGLATAGVAAVVAAVALPAQQPRLGRTTFPTSGAAAAQQPFIEGVLWLHSFEYQRAAEAFREAQRRDPSFALAYWGEAMTYNHPVWFEQDAEAACTALARLAPTPEARLAKAPTEREKNYLRAVDVLYGPGEKAARDTLYAAAMRALYETYPDDENAAAFYALALLGTSHGGRDIPTYMRAAAVVEEVFASNPQHPGAAHYLIHSYDDPVHAPLGLRAARAYSGVAPDAAHAQHMTTHIFVAVGMWDEVVSQNELAAGPDSARWMPGHYPYWLLYGYLQQGRYERALQHLEALRAHASRVDARPQQRAMATSSRADYVINTERWDSPVLQWPPLTGDAFPWLVGSDAFVRGMAAVRRGEIGVADGALGELTTLRERTRDITDPNDNTPAVVAILEKELRALLLEARGNVDGAISLLREAAAAEDAMPYEFGPPVIVKPTSELLGEVLLDAGQPAEARRTFEHALQRTPGRALALRGLARAASATGDQDTAQRAYRHLREIWHAADAAIPGLDEARAASAAISDHRTPVR